jgi:3-isopropylmalate/(R)-2-methylmalate dehydratase large subunit
LGHALSAKDMILATLKRLKLNTLKYGVAQYTGEAVLALSMSDRMVLTNMAAELGAQTGLIEPDATTFAALKNAGVDRQDAPEFHGDPDAIFLATWEFDANKLVPQVAAPHSPDNVDDVDRFQQVAIDQAYIGACTGAKLNDLHMAAEVLNGRKVARNVRLLIAPASTRMTAAAAADGTLATLTAAGAILLPSGCGACAGYGAGILAEDEVCISSTARNFKGRMGAASSQVYLGSPYTVAASAVTGRITDPRELMHSKLAP